MDFGLTVQLSFSRQTLDCDGIARAGHPEMTRARHPKMRKSFVVTVVRKSSSTLSKLDEHGHGLLRL